MTIHNGEDNNMQEEQGHSLKSMRLEQSITALENKIDEMYKKFGIINEFTKSIQETMGMLSDNLVTRDELLKVLEEKQASTSVNNTSLQPNVENDVVQEGALFAKQLIDLLEEAALKYVKERQSKDKLLKELVNVQSQYKDAQQQQGKDTEILVQKLGSRLKVEQEKLKRMIEQIQSTKQKVAHETTKSLIYTIVDTIGNIDEIWQDDRNLLFIQFLQENGVKTLENYLASKEIDVTEDTIEFHKKYVEGIDYIGKYKVTSSAFLQDEDVIRKAKVEKVSDQNSITFYRDKTPFQSDLTDE